jgi:hypothetical protein
MITIKWLGEDIKGYRPDWTDDQCDYVMDEIGTALAEACIEYGHEMIERLIAEFEGDQEDDWWDAIK